MKKVDLKKRIYLVDGSSFLYRAYYALRPLTAPERIYVQAVFGFCRMINKLIKSFSPAHFAVVWDSPGKTVRHEIYSDYKATRDAPPSDIFEQKKLIHEFNSLINLHEVMQVGIEADDLIASLAKIFEEKKFEVIIVSSDKDLRQIVSDCVKIFDPFNEVILGKKEIEEKYGFPVEKLPFYFGLIGDASDNIPGVRGIGPKGAEKLVRKFKSLENLYKALENDPESVEKLRIQKLLEDSRERAFLSERLFRLRYYEVDSDIEKFSFNEKNFLKARPLFERLGFKSLLREISKEIAPKELFMKRYGYNFKLIAKEEQLDGLCKKIKNKGSFAIDTETDTVRAIEAELIGVSICLEQGEAFYIPLGHTTGEEQLPLQVVKEKLQPILENKKIKKYLHHAKFDIHALAASGMKLHGLEFDTMVAAGLLKREGDRIRLKILGEIF